MRASGGYICGGSDKGYFGAVFGTGEVVGRLRFRGYR